MQKEGFEEIFPEQYSFTEQITIFRNAEIIVSGSGAALSNIIACAPGAFIICLVNRPHAYSYFSTIASYVGSHLIYLASNEKAFESSIHAPFRVDIHQLNETLNQVYRKQVEVLMRNSSSLA